METTIPFAGFYHSEHDEALDYGLETLFQNDRGDPISSLIEIAYNKANWGAIHHEYAKDYAESFAKHYGLAITYAEMISPREYNFTTDRLFCKIELPEVERMFAAVDKEKLDQKINERFTSRSGFISFYHNHLDEWPENLADWDCNQVGTLLEVFIEAHEDYQPEYESHYAMVCGSYEYVSELLSKHIQDDRLWKIYDYLRDREQRQWR